jgi:hypothetical protein
MARGTSATSNPASVSWSGILAPVVRTDLAVDHRRTENHANPAARAGPADVRSVRRRWAAPPGTGPGQRSGSRDRPRPTAELIGVNLMKGCVGLLIVELSPTFARFNSSIDRSMA